MEVARLAAEVDAWGCTDVEVARVAADQGCPLPPLYECFLRAMGRDAGGMFDGAYVSYPVILGARMRALRMLASDESSGEVFVLPGDALVISEHDQGYAFMFVRSSLGDDAPVEMWTEGEPAHSSVVFASVLAWVQEAFTDATRPELEPWRQQRQSALREVEVPPY